MEKVEMRLSEKQLALIMRALEDFFRLRMGQTYIDLIDDLAFQNIKRDENGKIDEDVFNECIWRREDARKKLQELFDICFGGPNSDRTVKTEEVENAIDIWHVIRHFWWLQRPLEKRGDGTDSYPVMRRGTEPLPEIEVCIDG